MADAPLRNVIKPFVRDFRKGMTAFERPEGAPEAGWEAPSSLTALLALVNKVRS